MAAYSGSIVLCIDLSIYSLMVQLEIRLVQKALR